MLTHGRQKLSRFADRHRDEIVVLKLDNFGWDQVTWFEGVIRFSNENNPVNIRSVSH